MGAVREVEDADLDAVGLLHRATGWTPPTREDWQRLWRDNPALADRPGAARGWVLLEQGRVVGYLANIVQSYVFRGRRLAAAAAASLVVDPQFRGSSLELYLAFVRQPGMDLLLNTTAAPQVSQISQFLKFKRIPQPDYNRSLYWILRPLAFAPAALRKKGVGRAPATVFGPIVGAALAVEGRVRQRGPRRAATGLAIETLTGDRIDGAFDEFWNRTAQAMDGVLLACRDATTLRWHFAPRNRPHPPLIVLARRDGRMIGYAAVVRQDAAHLGLTRARLADLVCDGDRPEIVGELLHAAASAARARGAAMLEVVGFPSAVRDVCHARRPREIVDDGWPFLYRASNAELDRALAETTAWRACLYDGDGSL